MPPAAERLKRRLNLITDRLHTLPLLVLMPHSRCNARCLMCDIWQANANKQELTEADLTPHLEGLRRLNVQRIVLSGGEALMHDNLFLLARMLIDLGAKLTLLSTGLTLEKHAEQVVQHFDEVTLSLDGPPDIHDQIRNIPRAYEKLKAGVTAIDGRVRVTGRSVVQRLNFMEIGATIDAAREAGLDQISFLPVDVSSEAFNREGGWGDERISETALTRAEALQLRDAIEALIAARGAEIAGGFVAESPDRLRNIAQYFLALCGHTVLPPTQCNAPWTSAVVEADGTVRPCFFHPPFGNIREQPLDRLLDAPEAVRFRRNLDVSSDPICRRCVCTLTVGPTTEL